MLWFYVIEAYNGDGWTRLVEACRYVSAAPSLLTQPWLSRLSANVLLLHPTLQGIWDIGLEFLGYVLMNLGESRVEMLGDISEMLYDAFAMLGYDLEWIKSFDNFCRFSPVADVI